MVTGEQEEESLYEGLPEVEKESWIKFHEQAYKDDMNHAEKDLIGFPRWSIISGYYAMHDITKLYLGKVHNIKVVGKDVHSRTISALNKFIQDKREREKAVGLLTKAGANFFNVLRLEEKALPLMLRKGKSERGKTQYYSMDFSDITSKRSVYFFDKIVYPYITIIEGMLSGAEDESGQEEEGDKNAA